jgi:pyruvate formate lyase activating enzyme
MCGEFDGIIGWQKNSYIDYPGVLSTVLFYRGCNLRCPFCHNPQIVNGTLEHIDSAALKEFLKKRRGMIDGVVFTGGEPTLHDSIHSAASFLRAEGYRIKLDTNGLLPERIVALAPDYCALDFKTSPSLYPSMLGSPYTDNSERLAAAVAHIRSLEENGEVRITLAPPLLNEQIVYEIAERIAGVARVYLQQFNTREPLLDPSYNTLSPLSREEVLQYRDIIAPHVGSCHIRGEL